MTKLLIALGILSLMIILAASDAIYVEGGLPIAVLPDEPSTAVLPTPNTQLPTEQSSSEINVAESTGVIVPVGIRKTSGPDVLKALQDLGFQAEDSSELTILRSVIPVGDASVMTYAILKDEDRAGLIAWTESPRVKTYFLSLKEALHTSFSPRVTDLLDETQRIPGKPPRNFLTFLDPGLTPERMVFLRVRERLYELRIAKGHDDEIFGLVEALTE